MGAWLWNVQLTIRARRSWLPGTPRQVRCVHIAGGRSTCGVAAERDRSGSLTYFWRHQDGVSLDCPTRPSVVSRVRANDGF